MMLVKRPAFQQVAGALVTDEGYQVGRHALPKELTAA